MIKDANELLQAWCGAGMGAEEQKVQAQALLALGKPIILIKAEMVGRMEGARRDEGIKEFFKLARRMDPEELALYRTNLAKTLKLTVREFDGVMKAGGTASVKKSKEAEGEPEYITGGWIGDHLVELVYDGINTGMLVKYPDGRVEMADKLEIDGRILAPVYPDTIMRKHAVLFPSEMGTLRSPKEMTAIIRGFIHRYLDVDEFYEKLATYYVLFSWLYDCFQVLPYLRALGDYGTGKTRLIQTIGAMCYRPTFTSGASTTSPIFRMLDKYKGTLVLDEADFQNSSEAMDIIKILNTGYMKGVPVLRAVDRGTMGFDVEAYEVYGPKLIATRKRWGDQALESRCLTKEMGDGVPRADIPIILPKEFWMQAQAIRNLLLAYRLKHWKPEIEVDYSQVDRSVEPRLNQVTLALKRIVEEEELVEDIDGFVRQYNAQMVTERSMTMTARVLEGLVAAGRGAKVEAGGQVFLKDVTEAVNRIIDEQNQRMGDESMAMEDEDRKDKSKVVSRKVGNIVRRYLQLRTERWTSGENKGLYYVIWDEERIRGLCYRYGVDFEANGSSPGTGIYRASEATQRSFDDEREKWQKAGQE